MLLLGFSSMLFFITLPMAFCLSILDNLACFMVDNAALLLGLGISALLLMI